MAGELLIEDGPAGPVVRPPEPTGAAILYLPDGPGEAALDTARRLARSCTASVLVGRYRPAFPAAVEDVRAAYRECRSRGPVVVVGERLGGTLAATLLVQLRDWGAPAPLCAALVSPLLDATLQANSLFLNVRADPTLDAEQLRGRVADYAGSTPLADPLLSPLYANLHGLCPVQLLVAGTDLLLDDALAFAARAARSGVAVDLKVWPEAADLRDRAVPTIVDFIDGVGRRSRVRSSA